jgi:hypothetical protein
MARRADKDSAISHRGVDFAAAAACCVRSSPFGVGLAGVLASHKFWRGVCSPPPLHLHFTSE